MFSSRSCFDLTPNSLSRLLASKRAANEPVIDLTESNPTLCELGPPGDAVLEALARPEGLVYRPSAQGLEEARRAVAGYYRERGVAVDPRRLVLTASTSEAYSFLFKLLADPGQTLLAPRPSYPLFDYLAALEGIGLQPYRLDEDGMPGADTLQGTLTPETRGVLAVSPNNPTGQVLRQAELGVLDGLAGERGLAVIVDEVFADFLLEPGPPLPVAAACARHALTFSLSGLSKLAGLPQLKLSWILVGGPPELIRQALERLELIGDTFLSVSTPVQEGLGRLLAAGTQFRAACLERLRCNLATLSSRVSRVPGVRLLEPAGGWYACLRVPRLEPEEELVLRLLGEDGVAVHPGYFFDFATGSHLVTSLLPRPELFELGAEHLLRRFE